MSYQTKSKIANIAAYILLGIVVAGIIAVAVITLTTANRRTEPISVPETTGKQSSENTVIPKKTEEAKKTEKNQAKPTEKPKSSAEPSKTAKPTAKPTAKDTLPAYNSQIDSLTLPVAGYVMKEYSVDYPVFSFTMSDYRTHSGIDISAAEGSAVSSVSRGLVKKIEDDPMMGKTVIIDHGDFQSVYSNLDDLLPDDIRVGNSVEEGQIIGAVGSTSILEFAESDHLHFELLVNGKNVDPLGFLSYRKEDRSEM